MKQINWTNFCKNCGECCGIIPIRKKVFLKYQHLTKKPYNLYEVDDDVFPVTDDGFCVFLTNNKRCAIYSDRPKVCRLYGTIPELQCPKLRNEKTDLLAEYFSSLELKHKYIMK